MACPLRSEADFLDFSDLDMMNMFSIRKLLIKNKKGQSPFSMAVGLGALPLLSD